MYGVYRYPLQDVTHQTFELPSGAQILSVHAQRDQICLWVLADTEQPISVYRHIFIANTGDPIDQSTPLQFIGTVLMHGGMAVRHVFEQPV